MSHLTDQLTISLLRQFSRRSFLKAAGAAALAALPWAFGGVTALAFSCPPTTYGLCEDCYSGCVSGGSGCSCVCDTCNCDPPFAEAACLWYQIGAYCIFVCDCIAC
jgi:TAT (twin-arginine translocation) pathway-exported protein